MGMDKASTLDTYQYLILQLNQRGIAFIEFNRLTDGFYEKGRALETLNVEKELRPLASVPVVMNGGYDAQQAADAVEADVAAAISFGRPYLANPDLPTRYRHGFPLNDQDHKTFYVHPEGEVAKGYTDYPFLGLKPAMEKLTV